MANPPTKSLPLLELFTRLQDAGLRLGISEYQMALKALQGGFGLRDRHDLQRLCEILWTKSEEEKRVLALLLDQIMTPLPEAKPEVLATKKKSFPSIRRYLSILALLSTITAIAFIIWPRSEEEFSFPNVLPVPEQQEYEDIKPQPIQEENSEWLRWIIFSSLAISSGLGLFWGIQKFQRKPRFQQELETSPSQLSKVTQAIADEVEAAQAVQRLEKQKIAIAGNYLPVTQRQMKRSWRYFSRPVREGVPTELDVEATVEAIGHQGIYLGPVLVPPRTNRASLLLLIDHDGSMVPFHKLTERLASTAQQGGQFGRTSVYYFHNCPSGFFYRDPVCLEAERTEDVIARLSQRQLSALIVSDAGAVRGNFNPYRIKKTQEFLTLLRKRISCIAWLNVMPKERWTETSAEAIAHSIPMFECDRAGLDDAIEVLRGRKSGTELGL